MPQATKPPLAPDFCLTFRRFIDLIGLIVVMQKQRQRMNSAVKPFEEAPGRTAREGTVPPELVTVRANGLPMAKWRTFFL